MKIEEQVPRNALVWIIISLFALLAPHAGRLPVWVLAVYLVAAVWRTMVYRGRWSFPGRLVKLALTASAFAGILLSYGSLLGLEPMVALLLTAFALKLIELASRKDAYVLLFLGYFICITEFLFSQDLLIVIYVFVVNITLVTTALVALHQPGQDRFSARSLRLGGVMLLQALPLMVVLFFLFPRIGPLWTVPVKSHAAKTGVSDFLRPGDISQLSLSDEVAFRAQFEGEIPPKSQLYWRGLVFSRLHEGTWTSLRYYDIPPAERRAAVVATDGDPLSYSIIMEPTQQNWLFSLRYATSDTPGVMQASDHRLFTPLIIEQKYRYSVNSWPDAPLDENLREWRRETELKLPEGDNPRTRALAVQLRADAGSDEAFAQAVLDTFNREPFVYTLQPTRLTDQDAMDQFLFQTRQGFCEHYAYAFVVIMRAAGVPARVVAGYQGGEINPVNQTVIVHQFDAHAWAEIWLEGRGWVRVDPTAAVSPDRIELGLEEALAAEGSFLADSPLSPLRYRRINWINQLRLRYDALTYRWQSWVVGFNSEQQFDLLRNVLGEVSARRFALVFLVAWTLLLLPVAFTLLRRRDTRELRPLDRAYLQFCDRLANSGIPRAAGETPDQFAQRVAVVKPELAAAVTQLTRQYNELAYGSDQDARANEQFTREVAKFRPSRRPGNDARRTSSPAAGKKR